MVIYLIPAGATPWSETGRVQGWRHINLNRESKRKIKEMARALKEKGVQKVFCSDLHAETGFAVGRELRVPTMAEKGLRHFNVGRHAGKYRDEVEQIIEMTADKWAANPTIPISGGDSWASYTQRLGRSFGSILKSKLESVVIVLDVRGIQTFKEMLAVGNIASADPKKSLLEKHGQVNPEKVLVVRLTLS